MLLDAPCQIAFPLVHYFPLCKHRQLTETAAFHTHRHRRDRGSPQFLCVSRVSQFTEKKRTTSTQSGRSSLLWNFCTIMGYDSSDYDDSDSRSDVSDASSEMKNPREATRHGAEGGGQNKTKKEDKSIFDFSEGDDDSGDEEEGRSRRKKRRAEAEGPKQRWRAKGRGGMTGEDESSSDDSGDDSGGSEGLAADGPTTAPVRPFFEMMAELIALLTADESVSEAFARLSDAAAKEKEVSATAAAAPPVAVATAQSKKDTLYALTKDLLAQHSVPTLSKDRAELVALYYSNGVAGAAAGSALHSATTSSAPAAPLPKAYAIEWAHGAGRYFGPFTAAQMQGWRDKGVFGAKKALTRDINAKTLGPWVDANTIATY